MVSCFQLFQQMFVLRFLSLWVIVIVKIFVKQGQYSLIGGGKIKVDWYKQQGQKVFRIVYFYFVLYYVQGIDEGYRVRWLNVSFF